MKEFINLKQDNLSVKEYSLKFTLLYMYAPFLVENPRYLIYRFMNGVYELVKEECCMALLGCDMDITRLMVFSQQIEESKLMNESCRQNKRSRFQSDKFFHASPRTKKSYPG